MVEDHWSVCECVWVWGGGMNKSFQCSGPVPGQAAKASKKRESLAPRKGRFPLHSEDEDRCTGQ